MINLFFVRSSSLLSLPIDCFVMICGVGLFIIFS